MTDLRADGRGFSCDGWMGRDSSGNEKECITCALVLVQRALLPSSGPPPSAPPQLSGSWGVRTASLLSSLAPRWYSSRTHAGSPDATASAISDDRSCDDQAASTTFSRVELLQVEATPRRHASLVRSEGRSSNSIVLPARAPTAQRYRQLFATHPHHPCTDIQVFTSGKAGEGARTQPPVSACTTASRV